MMSTARNTCTTLPPLIVIILLIQPGLFMWKVVNHMDSIVTLPLTALSSYFQGRVAVWPRSILTSVEPSMSHAQQHTDAPTYKLSSGNHWHAALFDRAVAGAASPSSQISRTPSRHRPASTRRFEIDRSSHIEKGILRCMKAGLRRPPVPISFKISATYRQSDDALAMIGRRSAFSSYVSAKKKSVVGLAGGVDTNSLFYTPRR